VSYGSVCVYKSTKIILSLFTCSKLYQVGHKEHGGGMDLYIVLNGKYILECLLDLETWKVPSQFPEDSTVNMV